MKTISNSTKDSSKMGCSTVYMDSSSNRFVAKGITPAIDTQYSSPRTKNYFKSIEMSKAFHDTKRNLKENLIKELGQVKSITAMENSKICTYS
jgi:hypothetical protein